MKKPEKYIDCPVCGKQIEVSLENVEREITQDWWLYKCLDCKCAFTTTESDTLSMEL